MDSHELEAKILIEIKDVRWFRLIDNNKQLLSKGVFRICSLAEQNIYYLTQDDFYFTIQKQIPFIVAPFKAHRTYIFPHIEHGFNAICVELDDPVIVQLEIILANLGTFLTRETLPYQDEDLRNGVSRHCVSIFESPLIEDDTTLHYIKKGGGLLKEGFMWLGKVTSTGVNKAGNYLESKITTTKNVEISSETKEKFNNIKNTASKTLTITGGFLKSVLTPMVEVTSKFVEDMNKKIDEGDNKTLKQIKKVGGATLDATSEALTGLSSGAKEIGKSLGSNTRNLVEKKYGDDITTTFVGKHEKDNNENQPQGHPDSSQLHLLD